MTWHVAIKKSKMKPGKKKMLTVAKKLVLLGQMGEEFLQPKPTLRHMRWPLAYGLKSRMIVLGVHFTKQLYRIDTGEMVEWSPFPLSQHMGNLSVNSVNKKI